MLLSIDQFDVLVYLERNQERRLARQEIAQALELIGSPVDGIIDELDGAGLIVIDHDGSGRVFKVTDEGYALLEPYRVRRAIFMAAGFGGRLVPITLNTPKPLIRVHGERIIDTLIDAVLAVGITDITIVRGYLGEQFDQLLYKYPMIKFIENPIYDQANNISSALCFKDMMADAYVLESDLLLNDPSVIRRYEYDSNYTTIPVRVSDDWCFETEDGIITAVKVGGTDVDQMVGISYWTSADAAKMSSDIVYSFNLPKGSEKYWDVIALDDCKEHYRIMSRHIHEGDVIELDTFDELKAIDPAYDV